MTTLGPRSHLAPALPLRSDFDEEAYVQLNPDVAAAIAGGVVGSGWQHFTLHGFAEGRPWVAQADPLAGVNQEIAPGDGMYRENAAHYFEVGASALRTIEAALFTACRPAASIRSILDLPCGYGRVLRFLRKAFPQAALTACDLNRGGVEFCAKTFGAKPVVSHERADKIPLTDTYDLIWCGSLLTHFDEATCRAFLQRFHDHLRPHGLLVFTSHGRRCEQELESGRNRCGLDQVKVAQLLEAYRRTGFGYVDYTPGADYGISLARPSYLLAEWVEKPGWQLVSFHESGWDARQDVIGVQRID